MSIYTEPTREFKVEQSTIPAKNAKVGDVRVKTHGSTTVRREVADVKVGTKWVYLRDADGKLIDEASLDAGILVEREVETYESGEARIRYYNNTRIEQAVETREPRAPKALAKVAESISEYGQADSFRMGALITAQAEDVVWARFRNYVEQAVEHGEDHVAARDAYVAELRQAVSRKVSYGLLSRSTSTVSNTMEDAELSAMASFAEDRWY